MHNITRLLWGGPRIEVRSLWWKTCEFLHFFHSFLFSFLIRLQLALIPKPPVSISLISSCKRTSLLFRADLGRFSSCPPTLCHQSAGSQRGGAFTSIRGWTFEIKLRLWPAQGWLVSSPLLYWVEALSWEQLSCHISVTLLQVLGQWRLNRLI